MIWSTSESPRDASTLLTLRGQNLMTPTRDFRASGGRLARPGVSRSARTETPTTCDQVEKEKEGAYPRRHAPSSRQRSESKVSSRLSIRDVEDHKLRTLNTG